MLHAWAFPRGLGDGGRPGAPGSHCSIESDRLDEVRAAFTETAASLGLTHAEYDMANEDTFRELLALETDAGITRFANVELFAGKRFVAGSAEVIAFLGGLKNGTESLESAGSQTAGPQVSTPPASATQVQATGPVAPAAPATTAGGGFRTETVPGPRIIVTVGPAQLLKEWCRRTVTPWMWVTLALVGISGRRRDRWSSTNHDGHGAQGIIRLFARCSSWDTIGFRCTGDFF